MRHVINRRLVAAIPLAMLAVTPLRGHHSFSAEFDASRPVTLEGRVTKMDWVNPHAWIHLEVKRPDGSVEQWMIEGGAPNALFRRGFRKNSLPVGTQIIAFGFQAKDGSRRANGRDLTLPDGRKLFMGSAEPVDRRDPSEQRQ